MKTKGIALSSRAVLNQIESYGRALRVTSGGITTGDEDLMAPLYGLHPALRESRNYCEALDACRLTGWKYWIVANFYLTAWLTYPARLPRIVVNIARGRETTALEKFLGETVRRLGRKLRPGVRQPQVGVQAELVLPA